MGSSRRWWLKRRISANALTPPCPAVTTPAGRRSRLSRADTRAITSRPCPQGPRWRSAWGVGRGPDMGGAVTATLSTDSVHNFVDNRAETRPDPHPHSLATECSPFEHAGWGQFPASTARREQAERRLVVNTSIAWCRSFEAILPFKRDRPASGPAPTTPSRCGTCHSAARVERLGKSRRPLPSARPTGRPSAQRRLDA